MEERAVAKREWKDMPRGAPKNTILDDCNNYYYHYCTYYYDNDYNDY